MSAEPADEGSTRSSARSDLPRPDFASRLFGYDIFISFALGPAPRGTQSYASDLARRLRERDLKVFYSEDEMPAGAHLSRELDAALVASRALVVIANRETLRTPRWVRAEVERFRNRHPTRPVIPVNIDRALQDAELAPQVRPWLPFDEVVWQDESAEAVTQGLASEAVVERIAAAPRRLKTLAAWRWTVRTAFVAAVGAAIALGFTAKLATDNAAQATQALQRATALRLAAEAESMLTGNRAEGDERALLQLVAAETLAPQPAVSAAIARQFLLRPGLQRLLPTQGPVLAFAASPDGHRFAYATEGDRIHVIKASTGQPAMPAWTSGGQQVLALAFSPDGRTLASAQQDATVRLWNADSGQAKGAPWRGHQEPVEQLAFSPDGRWLASGGADTTVRVWPVANPHGPVRVLEGHDGRVTGLAFGADGSELASVSFDRTLKIWRHQAPHTGPRTLREPHGPTSALTAVAFSPDGRQLVTGGTDDSLVRWSSGSLKRLGNRMTGHAGTVRTLAYSPDGRHIVSAAEDGTLRRWDAATGLPAAQALVGHRGWILHATFRDAGRQIVSAALDSTIRIWSSAATSPLVRTLDGEAMKSSRFALSLDGSTLATSRDAGRVTLWRPLSADGPVAEIADQGLADATILLAPAGDYVFAIDGRGWVRSWRVAGASPTGPAFPLTQGGLLAAAISDDGARMAGLGTDGRLFAGELEHGRLHSVRLVSPRVDGVALSFGRDACRLIVRTRRGPAEVFDLRRSEKSRAVGVPGAGAVAGVSPDLRRAIALPLLTDTAQLIDAASALAIGPPLFANRTQMTGPPSPTDPVGLNFHAAFDRVDSFVATAAGDKAIRLWSVSTGEMAGPPLQGHEFAVAGLAMSRDARLLASIDRGGFVRVWNGPASWKAMVCARLARDLTPQEWARWVSPELPFRCACGVMKEPADPGREADATAQVCERGPG